MASERLQKQIQFILEVDKLKQIFRQNHVSDGTRFENDAEHSWHMALMIMLLSEYAAGKVDAFRVMKMMLVHDIVEIDAGDTYCYDEAAKLDQAERELKAAERIFNLLPEDQAKEIWSLWEEFEARKTADARFAAAIDRFQPLMLSYHTRGIAWKENSIKASQVIERNSPIGDGAPELWEAGRAFIEEAIQQGILEV
ncbi:MAG: HD domain-containing protein [Planctomycetota bacterium]|nr:HD domain-containing protein [Planctomycetota bacterium]MDA1137398.1 HD domain-containing protein [Planctomycetota bacterium]